MPENRQTHRLPALALFLLLLGTLGIAAFWVLFSMGSHRQLSWMAVLAAFDAAWLLRLGGMTPSWLRSWCAVLSTVVTIVLANWGIAAAEMGGPAGLLPWESMTRMGAGYAWTLSAMANTVTDFAWLAAALIIAAIAAR